MGELDLQTLDGLMELVAEVLVDEGDEGSDLFRLLRAKVGGFEDSGDVAGLEEGEVMPAFEVGVDPGGGGRDDPGGAVGGDREGLFEAVGSERGRDELADDAGVEGVPGETETGVTEDPAR